MNPRWKRGQMAVREDIHPEVIKAYKKSLDAEHRDGEYGTTATKRAVTRTANTLSKKINQHHPDLDMQGKIKLRTQLQNMHEDAPATSTASVAGAGDDGIVVIDKRRRKDKQPRLLKRFRKYLDSDRS